MLVLDGHGFARAVAGAALVVLLLVLASLLLICSSCCCLQALTHDVVVVRVVMVVLVMGYGSRFIQAAGATHWCTALSAARFARRFRANSHHKHTLSWTHGGGFMRLHKHRILCSSFSAFFTFNGI